MNMPLSPQRGLKMLAKNRKAGSVPVFSGDRGVASSMWDSLHLASTLQRTCHDPLLGTCVRACARDHLCAREQNV